MSAVAELRQYIDDWGVVRLTTNLGRRARQHATYRLADALDRPPTFPYQGRQLTHFWHPYNRTWLSERALEIPIARDFLARMAPGASGLEIGNVLAHYQPVSHRVVDKYEQAPGVENLDVVDVTTAEPLDYVIAISTIEHVGWDEPVRDLGKAVAAVQLLRSLLRADDGRFLLTVPLGHNPGLDAWLLQGDHGALATEQYVRDPRDRWHRTDRLEAHQVKYLHDLRSAGCLWVGEFSR